MNRLTRRELMQAGLASLGAAALSGAGEASEPSSATPYPFARIPFSFHYDHILGTSLDVWGEAADAKEAERVEQIVLRIIESRRQIFSLYDPESELSRLNRTRETVAASPELCEVLFEYEKWQRRTNGACSAMTGSLVKVWAEAERTGVRPDVYTLSAASGHASQVGWRIDADNDWFLDATVTRLTDEPLNLNSIAKGAILAGVLAFTQMQTKTSSLLINLGGDLIGRSSDGTAWSVAVQNPFRPEENAPPLTVLKPRQGAVATSGGYQRNYTINGQRHSHLIDPRAGQPADAIAAATVVAPDSLTANALATTLCILSPEEGLRLVATEPHTECLIIEPNGRQWRSPGFAALEMTSFEDPPKKEVKKDKETAWPDAFQVTINLELPKPEGRAKRPYVAIWVENADGKAVRTITVWGNKDRWLPEMSTWWKIGKDDPTLLKAVTRATRAPGKYAVVWDGKDDAGKALPQGSYTLKIEVHREHGKHMVQTGKIVCGPDAAKLTLEKNVETGETLVTYGKKE